MRGKKVMLLLKELSVILCMVNVVAVPVSALLGYKKFMNVLLDISIICIMLLVFVPNL
jgi:hypothetical protein